MVATLSIPHLLCGYVEDQGLGEVFNGPAVLRLRPGADKQPDVFFLGQDRRNRGFNTIPRRMF